MYTGKMLRVQGVGVLIRIIDHYQSGRLFKGHFHRIGQAFFNIPFHNQPVDNQFHIMLFIFIQHNITVQAANFAIDPHPHVPFFAELVEYFTVLPFAAANHRCQHLDT